ncbi:MAG: insulinase family protein, partial [Deltaproteobacteria bacterium]|nr:insulinase family protein [Deltaproteobacteria bacterium]
MNRLVCLLAVAIGCGGGVTSPDLVPQLPSDGDINTAKPTAGGGSSDGDPWAGRTDLITAPKSKTPSALALPKIERFKLPSGLRVIVIEDKSLPVVAIRLAVKAGRMHEGKDRVGLASFVAGMLDKGTRSRKAAKIAEAIDFVGGSLRASSDFDGSYVSCQVRSEDISTCLSLLPDVVVNPTFPKSEMKTVRENLMAEVRGRRDNAGQLATAHFVNELWGDDNPRGWVLSAKTVQGIEHKDLVAFHRTWFKPNNAVLVVAGDVNSKALPARLRAAFRTWRKGKLPEQKSVEPPALNQVRVRLVDKPDQTQSHIRVGHFGLTVGDRDFYDALIFNYALGGGAFSSRLMKVVRSEAGKTYGASSTFNKDRKRGSYWISTFTRNSETRATIDLLLQELGKMAKDGPTAKEVGDAIANIAGSYSTSFQSADAFAAALLAAELAGFGPDYVRDYALKVGNVTPDSARRAAAARLDPDDLVIVVVGNAKQVKSQLEGLGKIEVVDYMDPVMGHERKAQKEAQSASVSQEDQAKAVGILEKALAKKGGKRLAKVKNLELMAEAKLTVGAQSLPVKMSRVMVRPDKLQLVMEVMGGKQIITVASKIGWVKQEREGQSRVQEIPARDLRAARSQLWRDQELVLLRFKEKGTTAKLVESKGKHHVIDLRKGNWQVRLFINRKSMLLDKMVYQEGGEQATEEYSNYKLVDGIRVAHRRKSA